MKWNQLLPELDVFNLEESLDFYTRLIGFKVVYDRPEDKFAFLELDEVQIMIQEDTTKNTKWATGKIEYPLGIGINFQIDVPDVLAIYNRLKEDNYKIFVELEDHWYRKDDKEIGCREFLVQDPNGYALRFSQDLGYREIKE